MAKQKKSNDDDQWRDPRDYVYSAENMIVVYHRDRMLADRQERIQTQQATNDGRSGKAAGRKP